MAKTLSEAPLTTRNARAKLPTGTHWRGLDVGVHLGYRKGAHGGVWLVRWRAGKGYKRKTLGPADDFTPAGTFTIHQASTFARQAVEAARIETAAAADGVPMTIADAVTAYAEMRDRRASSRAGRPVLSDAANRLARHVTGRGARGRREAVAPTPLASVDLHRLTERHLMKWYKALPGDMKASGRQRLINDLKAALNAAAATNRDRLPANLPGIIKHGLRAIDAGEDAEPVARDNQILTDGQVARLVKAAGEIDARRGWEGDLYRMVLVLAATGARMSQVRRLAVSNCQLARMRLMMPSSRKGRGGGNARLIPVPIGQDVLDALAPVVMGRASDAALLERWRHRQTGPATWKKEQRGPWQSASELRNPWKLIAEHASMPGVIPYALRHSSIVRGIRANLPIRLVAAQHATSVAMIEKHYAAYISDGLEDMARAAIVPLAPNDGDNVVRLGGGG